MIPEHPAKVNGKIFVADPTVPAEQIQSTRLAIEPAVHVTGPPPFNGQAPATHTLSTIFYRSVVNEG